MTRFQIARSAALAFALLGPIAAAGAAASQTPVDAIIVRSHRTNDSDVKTVKVNYADLDLRSGQGANSLAGRLLSASDEACGGRPANRASSVAKLEFTECRSNAMYDAVHAVRSPMLTRVTHGGRAPALPSE